MVTGRGMWLSYLRPWVLPEPEEALWRALWMLIGVLALLKGSGVLLVSWWWVAAPLVIPLGAFLLVFLVGLIAAVVGSLLPDDMDGEDGQHQ